jgi:hypothetical protein
MTMKKTAFLLLIPFITIAGENKDHIKGNGQVKSETRQVGSYNKISTGGSIDVIIEQGPSEGVEVTTDENLQNYIVTEIKDNTLNIHVKKDHSVSPTKLVVKATFRELKAISAGGSGDISSSGEIKTEDLAISQGGSGDFKLKLNAGKVEISKAGSGDFDLEGKIQSLEISSAGSGDVDASDTSIGNAEISMVGSGDIVLPKGTKPRVSSVGSGEVHYE